MMTEFKDKVALITGAANGFGKVFAMEAVKRGMKVAIVDIDGDDLFGVTALLKKMGGEVLPIEADVTDYSQVKMSVDKTMETFGQIDVLFANAGIAPSGDIFNLPARDWQWTAYANLISHGWYYSLVLPIMAKQGTACHIIATASIAGILHGIGNNPAYSATKHAAVALAEDVRAYCKTNNYNIGVSVYCPAYVQTDLHHTERHRPERFASPMTPTTRASIILTLFAESMSTSPQVLLLSPSVADCSRQSRRDTSTSLHIISMLRTSHPVTEA